MYLRAPLLLAEWPETSSPYIPCHFFISPAFEILFPEGLATSHLLSFTGLNSSALQHVTISQATKYGHCLLDEHISPQLHWRILETVSPAWSILLDLNVTLASFFPMSKVISSGVSSTNSASLSIQCTPRTKARLALLADTLLLEFPSGFFSGGSVTHRWAGTSAALFVFPLPHSTALLTCWCTLTICWSQTPPASTCINFASARYIFALL